MVKRGEMGELAEEGEKVGEKGQEKCCKKANGEKNIYSKRKKVKIDT